MMFPLNKPILSLSFALLALFLELVLMLSMRYLSEPQGLPTLFIVLAPAIVVFAVLGHILGAFPASGKNSRPSIIGYLISGGILISIVIILMSPAF